MSRGRSLTRSQRFLVARLIKESIDCVMLPDIPERNIVHEKSGFWLAEATGTDMEEEISLWVPSASSPNVNPPVLRRFIDYRLRDRQRSIGRMSVTFPDTEVSYHAMTVRQLEKLHSLAQRVEDAVVKSPSERLGIPVEWWYGAEEDQVGSFPNPEKPDRYRSIGLISDPIRSVKFNSNDEHFEALNTEFEACWDYLQAICSTPRIEGVEEHYDIDPHRYAELLLDGRFADP